MEEKWKDIEGYEGYYQISNYGNVKSLDRIVYRSDRKISHLKSKIKKQTYNSDGYLTVKLSKNGIDARIATHILVAKAFVQGYFDKAEVNHIDCNRTNNRADNLEWVTHYDNIAYSIKCGNHVSVSADYSGSNNPNYGNHKLKELYANNKDLAKTKQGRIGQHNGRAIPVKMILKNGEEIDFSYISECSKYIINNSLIDNKDWKTLNTIIGKCLENNTTYKNINFSRL